VLKQNNHVENATSRVRILRMAEYSIEVEIYAYILVRDYAEFLALQEELILAIVDAIEKTGAAIALPTVGPILRADAWIDPEKAKAAKARSEKLRDSGAPDGNLPPHLILQKIGSWEMRFWKKRRHSERSEESPYLLVARLKIIPAPRTYCKPQSTRYQIPAETNASSAPTTRA
jgi:hypothetical protein